MPVKCVCQVCGKEFYVPPSDYKRGRGKHCSRKCLAVTKTKEMRGNQRAKGHGPNSTTFKPGHVPWNKDLKGIHLSPDSEFQEGDVPANRVPVGTVTIRTDKGGHQRRWIKLHNSPRGWSEFARVVWINEHGSIPDDMVIHHIDQDPLNDDVENLELLTRAEHIEVHRRRT